jgi:hypothetical protein
MRADRWDRLGGFGLRPVEGPPFAFWRDDPWDRTDFGICIATISELVRSPQLLNWGKHVSELSRAIAVAAQIEADDDPHRKFIAAGFEERLKAGKNVVQSTEIGDEDSQIVGHGRPFNHPAGAVRPYRIT